MDWTRDSIIIIIYDVFSSIPSPALITCHLFNYSNARVVVAGRLAKWLNYSKLQGKDSPVVLLDTATAAADGDNPCQHSQ